MLSTVRRDNVDGQGARVVATFNRSARTRRRPSVLRNGTSRDDGIIDPAFPASRPAWDCRASTRRSRRRGSACSGCERA